MKIKRVFGSVVAVAFQITFHVEIHANDFFYFEKIIFNISISKRFKIYKLYYILIKKIKLFKNVICTCPNAFYLITIDDD